MKRFLALALCALFACQAEARTLYVDAKRPNNNGNGLSAKKAKKTLQAAINIAKKGDTILVYPGTYAPIETNNKKITIKAIKGKSKTKLVLKKNDDVLADFTKAVKKHDSTYNYDYTVNVGNATVLSGFTLDGQNLGKGYGVSIAMGGTLKSCTAKRFYVYRGFHKSKLENCLVQNNFLVTTALFHECTVQSTTVTKNRDDGDKLFHGQIGSYSTFANCLVAGNSFDRNIFGSSTLVNCTIARNTMTLHQGFHYQFSVSSKYVNCILWNNFSQREDEPKTLQNSDEGNTYTNTDTTNKNPKFAKSYKLKKGSYCINAGKLTKAQKKLVGKTDLAGKARIKGKAIDRGCYEY